MNFLSHARHFLDEPYAAFGTALPDLVSMADRRNRLKRGLLTSTSPREDALIRGAEAHFSDDIIFHQRLLFKTLNKEVASVVRSAAPNSRATTLSHILVEVLIDRTLMERDPTLCLRYERALARVNVEWVAQTVGRWLPRPSLRLAAVFAGFRRARFWRAYTSDEGVFGSMLTISRRLRLGLAPETLALMPEVRGLVVRHVDDLLAGTAGRIVQEPHH